MNNFYKKINIDFFNQIKTLVENNPRSYFNIIKDSKHKDLLNWINSCIPLLSNNFFTMSTKCNWILNGIVDFPICERCHEKFGQHINLGIHHHYSNTCPKCSRKVASENAKRTIGNKLKENDSYYDLIVEKRKMTNLNLHGDKNWNNLEKNKNTCKSKYGVDNVRKTKQCKESIKHTKKTRYSDPNYNNIEKFKFTCLANYGVEWPMQNAKIRSKSASKYAYDGFEFDSKQELCFYI